MNVAKSLDHGVFAEQQAPVSTAVTEQGNSKPQHDEEATDSDTNARPEPGPSEEAPPKPRRTVGRGGLITLKLLIEEGLVEPGEDVLSVEYRGVTYLATLETTGRIVCTVEGERQTFESPSAFSVFVKRLLNPTRKADDGWKTVKYQGHLLEHYKAELARRRLGDNSEASVALAAALEPRAKRARTTSWRMDSTFKFGAGLSNAACPEPMRRQRRAPSRFAAIGVDDEHGLQPLEAYEAGRQPFAVRVAPAAQVLMDFHAHLCTNEVIGVLVGNWNRDVKRIDVIRAIPIKELPTEDDSMNVEMDPEDQLARVDEAMKAGLRLVGWYHSHPSFAAAPSLIDIYNQVLQQNAHREDEGVEEEGESRHAEPYIAAIVSPYDTRARSLNSSLAWFYVDHFPGAVPAEGQHPDEVGCVAKSLVVEALNKPLGQLDNLPAMQREMEELAKHYAQLPDRANLEAPWGEDGRVRAEKMVHSLLSWIPRHLLGEHKVTKFGEKVLFSTRAVWSIYGKPLPLGPAGFASGKESVPTSGAVSVEAGEGNVSGQGASGGNEPQEGDEPISEDDAETDVEDG